MSNMKEPPDFKGKKFSRLTAVSPTGKRNKDRRLIWLFLCDCGKKFEVSRKAVETGNTKSCGCWYKDSRKLINKTHGMSNRHPTYISWAEMKNRCSNPKHKRYKDYGGRGITFDPKWTKFEAFYKDMGPSYQKGLSIDRINNNKEYSKENCRWATYSQQARNRRDSVVYKGENALDAALRLGGHSKIVHERIYRGWTLEKAFTTKNRNHYGKR